MILSAGQSLRYQCIFGRGLDFPGHPEVSYALRIFLISRKLPIRLP